MSDRTNGVLFETTERLAVEFFRELTPRTFLRLTAIDEQGLYGIYAEGWPGDREVLDEIASRASGEFGMSVRYCYEGAVGFCNSLYENGQQTRSDDSPSDPSQHCPSVQSLFGRDSSCDDLIEQALCWRNPNWLLERTGADWD